MRLTLRTLLAFRHGLLPAAEAAEIAGRIQQSDVASQLLARTQSVAAEDQAAPATPPSAHREPDPNTLAEYLDNILPPPDVAAFEMQCLESDQTLAELVAVHQIVTRVLSEPVDFNEPLRMRLQGLSIEAPPVSPPIASPPMVSPPIASPPVALLPVVSLPVAPTPIILSPGVLPPSTSSNVVLSDGAIQDDSRELPLPLWERAYGWYEHRARYYVQSALIHVLLFLVVGIVAGRIQALKRDDPPRTFDTALGADLAQSYSPPLDLGHPLDSIVQESQAPKEFAASPFAESLDRSQVLQPDTAGNARRIAGLDSKSVGGGAMTASPGSMATNNDRPTWATELNRSAGASGRQPAGRRARPRSSAAGGGVVAAAGVDSAVDGILSSIQSEMASDDLLVVWLFDASLSLYDDRQQVAARIEPFYRQIDGRHNAQYLLMNAAVAFGASTAELVAPTRFGLKMVEAVAQTPIDNTGLENVMTAVEQCVFKYRKHTAWKGSILIVIWTDESGDDTLRLEDTIALCRREGVVVSVVGPSSAFGSERGMHPYLDTGTGYRFLLPIKRGPDTSFAERLAIPYWHDSLLPPWTRGGAQVDLDLPWYGGPYREGLLSGVGPYALTRLALETGGKFTLLDHAYTAGPFKFEAMKPYLPDYGSASEYLRSVRYHPLRKAIFDAVQLTYLQQEALTLPTMSFMSGRSSYYPFAIVTGYLTPADFRQALAPELAAQKARMPVPLAVLEQSLAFFGADGMEKHYERESSPRWRAWYDLTRGRLLAMSVRHIEYMLTCDSLLAQTTQLNPDTNRIIFEPSSQLKSYRKEVLQRAHEAERLLKRCLEKNPDTPWASLAQWELDHPLGLGVRQIVIQPPLPGRGGGRMPAPLPSLPNL